MSGPGAPEDPAQVPGRSVGAALRADPEASGLTVDDVSARTCIRSQVVRDLAGSPLGRSGAVRRLTCAPAGLAPS